MRNVSKDGRTIFKNKVGHRQAIELRRSISIPSRCNVTPAARPDGPVFTVSLGVNSVTVMTCNKKVASEVTNVTSRRGDEAIEEREAQHEYSLFR